LPCTEWHFFGLTVQESILPNDIRIITGAARRGVPSQAFQGESIVLDFIDQRSVPPVRSIVGVSFAQRKIIDGLRQSTCLLDVYFDSRRRHAAAGHVSRRDDFHEACRGKDDAEAKCQCD
jgi:hypothetical protein